ncbi:MAG: restriction endonuclease [Anaerolineae bacterium]|nr:restriction endonuclease [Anaerolineae bacterium]
MARRRHKLSRDLDQLSKKLQAWTRREAAYRDSYRRALVVGRTQQWMRLSPTEFELYIGALFQKFGCDVLHTGKTADGGVDLIVEKNGRRGLVQCKRYTNPVGASAIRDFRGAMVRERVDLGFFVTTSRFTANARREAEDFSPTIVLYDAAKLAQLSDELEGDAIGNATYPKPIKRKQTPGYALADIFSGFMGKALAIGILLLGAITCCLGLPFILALVGNLGNAR